MTTSNDSALVLFSGGQDSTVALAWALERFARPIFATPKPAPPPEAMEEGGPSAVKAEDLD